jgi:hypothetical protein
MPGSRLTVSRAHIDPATKAPFDGMRMIIIMIYFSDICHACRSAIWLWNRVHIQISNRVERWDVPLHTKPKLHRAEVRDPPKFPPRPTPIPRVELPRKLSTNTSSPCSTSTATTAPTRRSTIRTAFCPATSIRRMSRQRRNPSPRSTRSLFCTRYARA